MPPLTAGRIAAGIGGVVALGYGGYYVVQSSELSALRKEQQGLETKVFVVKGRARQSESLILETDSLIKALGQQTELGLQAREEIAQQLAAARAAVAALEAQQEEQEKDIQRIQQDLVKARGGLDLARQDAVKFKQEAQAAERSLVDLRGRMSISQQRQVNPLHHPMVKELMGRK